MFKIESYVTPILLSYVDKYVRDFKPADAQVSLWGGGVALHNLVLKADVLQQEVSLPFTLVSGRIHELLIQVPWTKIMSEPIVVTIDTIECVLSLHPPEPTDGTPPPADSPSRKAPVVEAPPGYMQALVRRIVSNIALRVHHLIVKYVQDDIVLSLNVKHLAVDSAGANWEPAFADIDQTEPVLRRLVHLDDLTLCLDRSDADGKIRYYQEPLLYRCQLDLRVLTRLVSANTRRASNLNVQLRSTKLAFSVTSEQLVLLVRLLQERAVVKTSQPPPPHKTNICVTPLHPSSSNSAEPTRQESWSDWAWSWLPTWMDREAGVEEAVVSALPTPIYFNAYLDDISFVYKVMEIEGGTRKRARGILELVANHAAIKSFVSAPTTLRARFGTRMLTICSNGKCVCGYHDLCSLHNIPTVYLSKQRDENESEVEWKWPEEDFTDHKVETAQVVNEEYRETPELGTLSVVIEQSEGEVTQVEEPTKQEDPTETDILWEKMAPVVFMEFLHERTPPDRYANPYDNPPIDFQYSDWVEVCTMKIQIDPMEFRIDTNLLHRIKSIVSALEDMLPVPTIDLPMRTLTVEECDALSENLPQRSITLEVRGFRIRVHPWDHSLHEKASVPPLVLDIELPQTTVAVNLPMYPHRVCSAACQLPEDTGPLWQGARLHLSVIMTAVQVNINTIHSSQPRPCARADMRFLIHKLMNKEYFRKKESIELSYSIKIREANISGSAARLQAAYQVPNSLITNRASVPFKLSTLANDALNDSASVAIDVTIEEVSVRGYLTKRINTHIMSIQTARATAIQDTVGETTKQAWIFAAPEAPTTTPYLRLALQWCTSPVSNSLDYLGVWTEPISFSADPFLIAWLAYKPAMKNILELSKSCSFAYAKSNQYLNFKRRTTPPSSTSRSRTGVDMVHIRPRSAESSSEPSEKKQTMTVPSDEWKLDGEYMLKLHERLRHMLVNVELGLVQLYVTDSTVSALDSASVRDAMDKHAAESRKSVLALSLGRLSMHSNSSGKQLWQEIRHDGPTFITQNEQSEADSFPWRLRLAELSCYMLEARIRTERIGREKSASGGLRSQIKMTGVTPRTLLELITTTVTLSVVTKSLQIKTPLKQEKQKTSTPSPQEERTKYFTAGMNFRPSTLKEFVRGPSARKKPVEQDVAPKEPLLEHKISSGPVVSLGVHLHADTPPIIVRIDNDQVHMVATAIHCLQHIVKLLKRPPMTLTSRSYTSLGGSQRSLIRSVSELDEVRSTHTLSEGSASEASELISIFEAKSANEIPAVKLKTFCWFQWVVSRATLIVATQRVKMAFDIDDIISSVDLQEHYNQFKIKVASASVKHYERAGSEEWRAGVLGGRVLEVREPTDGKQENHFLAVTVTQAQISNLPASWKEELHPKLLEQKSNSDTMWEIYATLAPLEAVIQPIVVEHLISLLHQLAPRSFCPLSSEVEHRTTNWQWPFCYLTAGGLRLLVTLEEEEKNKDDTFLIKIGKITVNPHPDNPICRRPINSESTWTGGAHYEGRQYEMLIKNVAVQSSQFSQLVYEESMENVMKNTLENPALKWTQPTVTPTITPVLHGIDIGCVFAPILYISGVVACGPAVELNLMSDCWIELSVHQLALLRTLSFEMNQALIDSSRNIMNYVGVDEVCPYASVIMSNDVSDDASIISDTNITAPPAAKMPELSPSPKLCKETERNVKNKDFVNDSPEKNTTVMADPAPVADSGVETMTSQSKSSRNLDESTYLKKTVSVAFVEQQLVDASDNLEVFVTMGTIEISLYTLDDNTPEVVALRMPSPVQKNQSNVQPQPSSEEPKEITKKEKEIPLQLSSGNRSITETIRNTDIAQNKLELAHNLLRVRSNEGNLPLFQITLYQPNLYFWKKKQNRTLQISLFNAWVGLGMGLTDEHLWNMVLLSTAKGIPDPVTDIPPALATMKMVVPTGSTTNASTHARGTIRLDIERPVQFDVCTDRLRRVQGILALIDDRVMRPYEEIDTVVVKLPFLYQFRQRMVKHSMESVTIQTSQLVMSSSEGTMGCDSTSVQLASSVRPERAVWRGAVTAFVVTAGPPCDRRHVLLQPLAFGFEIDATWEAWRRAEGGRPACEPTIRGSLCFDRVTTDIRPMDLVALRRIERTLTTAMGKQPHQTFTPTNSATSTSQDETSDVNASTFLEEKISKASAERDSGDHYYKDDLRSGAFKIVEGGQLPMAYQVMVHSNTVSWRYPHPRAITRIVAFPIPGLNEEVHCALELFSPIRLQWMPHSYFKLPVSEPREIKLYVPPPDAVFGLTWRVRACNEPTEQLRPFEFNLHQYLPRPDPLITDVSPENAESPCYSGVTAEQLSGVLRVDSYFAPRLLPHTRFVVRVAALDLNFHNSLPKLSSQSTAFEGYYVSQPLMRSHRVLSFNARDFSATAHVGSPAGKLVMIDTSLSADILDCATGAIQELIEDFRLRSAVSIPSGPTAKPRVRCRTTRVHIALHVPRLRTLHSLAQDWKAALGNYIGGETTVTLKNAMKTKRELAIETAAALDGRVSMWIHNSCSIALRIGQEGTDEVVPLGSGARLAYRWRNPSSTKRLRVALAGPTTDWHWSSSIPFIGGSMRVRLADCEELAAAKQMTPASGVFVHVRIEEKGAVRNMLLSGRLSMANMLRHNLLYKVRGRIATSNQWRTLSSGELEAETVGRSVICSADNEMVLKIKFISHDTGWSGDIPLKECPKENVPWLVKVPSEGTVPYVSVWCRVVRARSDGRILATVWPLYVLHSYLPLDSDVMITTDPTVSSELLPETNKPPTLVQTAPGRGASTHLLAAGTTAARHHLSFKYRNIECPVTRDAVPMHYGVTDTSVFDKRTPVNTVDEVVQEILSWLKRSGSNAQSDWPYSVVSKHWPSPWNPALLQPRCDVTVRYQAIRAGGGCCLEIQLCPVVLLCNAAPIALTLRAHDAAPLCKLEPGVAISPPSAILKKPFFMSVEMGRETFVSGQLEVTAVEPGRYNKPPPGKLAVDHAAEFAIQCNHKVALLTMYYEIKENINVLGISSTYLLLNRLDVDILASAVAVPEEMDCNTILRPNTFKVVAPTKKRSLFGTPLCRFWLRGRWRGGSPNELRLYLCVALSSNDTGTVGVLPWHPPIPIRLGGPNDNARQAIALSNATGKSIPVVVTQHKHDNRWLISIAPDPCPQFVVYNRTRFDLAIAQPVQHADEPSTSNIYAVPDCVGIRWHCSVQPHTVTHYSTPEYCARYPPPTAPAPVTMPFLTFDKTKEDGDADWCPPVAVADGEQLLQLSGGFTIKMRVRTHPHSTLVELQDVDQNDISASDIRRRLVGPFPTENTSGPSCSPKLERADAVENVLAGNPESNNLPASETNGIRFGQLLRTNGNQPEITVIKSGEDLRPDLANTERLSGIVDSETSFILHNYHPSDWQGGDSWGQVERLRCVLDSVVIELASAADSRPLLALHADRIAANIHSDHSRIKSTLSISDVQIDNLQYESGQYDFAVVASTRASPVPLDRWPAIWNMFADNEEFATRQGDARLVLITQQDMWTVLDYRFQELTEVTVSLGPLALYVEDAYVSAIAELWQRTASTTVADETAIAVAEENILRRPLRLRLLHVHPLDLTLTLHTAVRMYIALDQSPLRLTAFRLQDMMTSPERLTHAVTVHYLSAAILGAGWVVGGLELLGAPGALAARVGGASGGVRGIASAAAAGLLRSLSAWAGSLARNLDLLAGDEEHARRAAAARRRPPQSFAAGLVAGITNFAINILGAVGGLAHHPLVGVAVGETESSTTALRRGLLGALTKPLSATADLVAYAGHGLLTQTGWDPIPQPRELTVSAAAEQLANGSWKRDCVRWTFRLADLTAVSGFEVLLNNASLQLLLTHKFLVVADPESEKIVEMIDLRFCILRPYQGTVIELCVKQRRASKMTETRALDEDDECQISAAAMARVARYTGAEGTGSGGGSAGGPSACGSIFEARVLALLPAPAHSYALYAALAAAVHHNADTHFSML